MNNGASDNQNGAPPTFDVLAMGELIVELVANRGGPLADSPTFSRAPGGAAAGVAAGVARLGRRAAFAGVVGDDPFGRYLARTLAAYGVDTSYLQFDRQSRTPVAFVARHVPDGEDGEVAADGAMPTRSDGGEFLFYGEAGTDQLLGPSAVPLAGLATARVLVCAGVALSNPLPRAALHQAMDHARASGVSVAFDANWRPWLWQNPRQARDLYREVVGKADILKLSVSELIMLTRGAASSEIRRQQALLRAWIERLVAGRDRPLLVALTRGPEGCSFALWKPGSGLQMGHLDAYEVEVKDRSGAGDAFLAALLVALLERQDAGPGLDLWSLHHSELEEAFVWANTAGALAAAHRGAMSGLPTRATIMRMIKGLNLG